MTYKVYLELEVSSQKDAHQYAAGLLEMLEEIQNTPEVPAHDNVEVWVSEVDTETVEPSKPSSDYVVNVFGVDVNMDEVAQKVTKLLADAEARRK